MRIWKLLYLGIVSLFLFLFCIFVLQLFAVIGPPTFLTFTLSAAAVAVIFYVVLVLIGRTTVKYKGKNNVQIEMIQ